MKKSYKEWIKDIWIETGGLVTQAVASKISGLNKSTINRRIKNKTIKGYKYNKEDLSEIEMIALHDALNLKNKKENNE